MHPLLQISIVVTAFFANALVIVIFMLRPSRQAKRVFDLTRDRVAFFEDQPKESPTQSLLEIFRFLRTSLGLRDNPSCGNDSSPPDCAIRAMPTSISRSGCWAR